MKNLRKILIGTLIIIVVVLIQNNLESLANSIGFDLTASNGKFIAQLVACIFWISMFYVINLVVNTLFWENLMGRKLDNKSPALLKYISGFILALILFAIITTQVFGKSLTGFLALSGGFGIVLGIALQNSIIDFFSGIIIHIEKPFEIGNFIMLNNTRISPEPLIGKVVSINWRTTRLQKTDGITVIVPNNQFTKLVVTNFDLPEEQSRFELEFCIGFEFDAERVIDVMLTALYSVDVILKNPKPKVKVPRTTSNGVIYQVRYWVKPTQTSPNRARDNVNRAILRYLHYAGIMLAYDKTDIHYAAISERVKKNSDHKKYLVSRVPIFKSLSNENLEYLYERMKMIEIKTGETIVQQGAADENMYIISEGHAIVQVQSDQDTIKDVGKIGPGQFFGEMSLILGEKRSASVNAKTNCRLFEISKETMKVLLEKDPDLLKFVVGVIDRRKHKNENILNAPAEETIVEQDRLMILKNRIEEFFKIG